MLNKYVIVDNTLNSKLGSTRKTIKEIKENKNSCCIPLLGVREYNLSKSLLQVSLTTYLYDVISVIVITLSVEISGSEKYNIPVYSQFYSIYFISKFTLKK